MIPKKDEILENLNVGNLHYDKNIFSNENVVTPSIDRLGIKSIKRIPDNPFIVTNKKRNSEYIKCRKELVIKLSVILNKHIHYWLQKEMPKFSKKQLDKHISKLLHNLQPKK